MRFFMLVLSIILMTSSFAASDDLLQMDKNRKQMLNSKELMGFPKPGSGVTIISRKQAELAYTPDMLRESIITTKQISENGYIYSDSMDPSELLDLKSPRGLSTIDSSKSDNYDTHIKKNLSQIKLAFQFKGLKSISDANIIGYAVGGMWKDTGWTWVTTYFDQKKLGVCQFNLRNLKLTDGAVSFIADTVEYRVNNKPGITLIKGSLNTGYIYIVEWADKNYDYEVKCANMNYNPDLLSGAIELAKILDKEIES